jgi:DNA mismatch repair ATPase MutS
MVIKSLVVGEHAEQWIKGGFTKKNGRDDLLKLSAHFQGKGNSSKSIHDAERLWDSLHYKNERALSFENFISKAQAMWNMFSINEETKSKSAQVRWLLNSIQDPTLVATIASLNVDVDKDPEKWDFDTCANHIASQIRKHANTDKTKKISAVQGRPSGGRTGIYKDGEIFTGTYSATEWRALSNEDRATVLKARSNKKGDKGKGMRPQSKKVQALQKKVLNQKKEIAALKKRAAPDEPDSESERDEPQHDAGNSFGGRAGKASKKQKSTD